MAGGRGRAQRRHETASHMWRRLKEYSKQRQRDLARDLKAMARFKEQPQVCSCRGCGNRRRMEKGRERLTMQERRAD